MERELEGWKGMRLERRSALGVPGAGGSEAGDVRSRRGSSIGPLGEFGMLGEKGAQTGSMRGLRRVSGHAQKGFL
jgi:myosin protein heavy chain